MRILAIRGRNCEPAAFVRSRLRERSSRGRPVRDHGAGRRRQSTLLDALCLAPSTAHRGCRSRRRASRRGQRTRWRLAAQRDPRSLLRRDARKAMPRRTSRVAALPGALDRAAARRRPDGRAEQEMTLVDLDRSVLVAGGRKTEVLPRSKRGSASTSASSAVRVLRGRFRRVPARVVRRTRAAAR